MALNRLAGIWIRPGRAHLPFTSTTLYLVCQDWGFVGDYYMCSRSQT
jgi:hypothetical protein